MTHEIIETVNLESLVKDLRALENEIIPQINELGEKLPEIYAGYASIVRTITTTLLECCSLSDSNQKGVVLLAEISTRAIAAYGQYKAAQEHNRLLQKYLKTKQAYATLNQSKIKGLLPKTNKVLKQMKGLFDSQTTRVCDFNSLSSDNIPRVADFMQRVLNMYRTALFFNNLATYLNKEYKVWLCGEQTSGERMPDYYAMNEMILKHLYGDNHYEVLESACDETCSLTGGQIMLLSDYQLFTMAISDEICDIDITKAAPHVQKILYGNEAIDSYISRRLPIKEHIESTPTGWVIFIGILTIVIIISMAIWFLPGSAIMRTIVAAIGCISTFKILNRSTKKINLYHFSKGDEMIQTYLEESENACGRVRTPDIDYNQKNALKEGVCALFNIK
jgi:hypothetical protein